jgi:hypothetical protein
VKDDEAVLRCHVQKGVQFQAYQDGSAHEGVGRLNGFSNQFCSPRWAILRAPLVHLLS